MSTVPSRWQVHLPIVALEPRRRLAILRWPQQGAAVDPVDFTAAVARRTGPPPPVPAPLRKRFGDAATLALPIADAEAWRRICRGELRCVRVEGRRRPREAFRRARWREEDHPRHPAGAPDGTGGEFRDKPGGGSGGTPNPLGRHGADLARRGAGSAPRGGPVSQVIQRPHGGVGRPQPGLILPAANQLIEVRRPGLVAAIDEQAWITSDDPARLLAEVSWRLPPVGDEVATWMRGSTKNAARLIRTFALPLSWQALAAREIVLEIFAPYPLNVGERELMIMNGLIPHIDDAMRSPIDFVELETRGPAPNRQGHHPLELTAENLRRLGPRERELREKILWIDTFAHEDLHALMSRRHNVFPGTLRDSWRTLTIEEQLFEMYDLMRKKRIAR